MSLAELLRTTILGTPGTGGEADLRAEFHDSAAYIGSLLGMTPLEEDYV